MSVVDNKTIDGIALTDDKTGIILLITDHVDWRDEYQHLVMLQEKINVYISYLEEKQYEDIYKGEDIIYGIIETSISPHLEPIISPALGVNPIEVSTHLPSLTADTDPPDPI